MLIKNNFNKYEIKQYKTNKNITFEKIQMFNKKEEKKENIFEQKVKFFSPQYFDLLSFAERKIADVKKFNVEDYKKLTQREIKSLIESSTQNEIETAKSNYNIGRKLINDYNSFYGEDNYIIVSLGTSPVGIARVMEFSGIETKYIPISGFKNFESFDEIDENSKGFNDYINFLNEQGINKETLDNTKKQIIFLDYTSTGKTLESFRNFLDKYIKLPFKNKENFQQVHFLSLNEELLKLKFRLSLTRDDYKEIKEYIKKYLNKCGIEKYSGIGHVHINNLEEINEAKEYNNNTAKRYNFLIMHQLNKNGLLKYNPLNEKSL